MAVPRPSTLTPDDLQALTTHTGQQLADTRAEMIVELHELRRSVARQIETSGAAVVRRLTRILVVALVAAWLLLAATVAAVAVVVG